jgi:alpha-D-ribose 1-methylphosphonate 5-phosphate C-P lyase
MTTEMMSKSSNQVLIKVPGKNRKKRIYFVPTYLRVKVKNFTSIDLGKLEAEANIDVIITFVYGNEYLAHLPH